MALASSEEAMGTDSGVCVPVFEVEGLEACIERMEAAGGSAGAIRDMGGHGRTVLVRDPCGAPMSLLEKA